MTNLSSFIQEPLQSATHSVIWLHGLGADGHDFAPIIPELGLPNHLNIRYVFPHAPVMPVTINNGYEMRAWFDIATDQLTYKIDNDGILKSISSIQALIKAEEQKGIPAKNILLAGFSQGALIALASGLNFTKPLAGIVALSGYLPENLIPQDKLHLTPIFIGHGMQDNVVPFALGEVTQTALKAAGYPVSWHSYHLAHSVSLEEIRDISSFIQKAFAPLKRV